MKGIIKQWYTLLLNVVRVKEYLQIIFSRASIKTDIVSSYLRVLDNIKEHIDVVIPLCYPMDAVVAGMEYKKKVQKIKLMPYLFDPFVESKTLHRTGWNKQLKKRANIKIEACMINLSAKVFCANHLKLHFSQFNKYENSFVFTEQPLLKKKQAKDCSKDDIVNPKIIATYTGIFELLIRNPEYFLRTMVDVLYSCNSELHLYTYSNCEKLIERYVNGSAGKIINHGFVTKEQADNAIIQSDVLMSVGNIDNTQVPSKIIEYISVCKPIIHFYTADNDEVLKTLNNYPLSICLKQDEALRKENVQKCVSFFMESKFKTIDFSKVEDTYYSSTPKFIADQILNIIDFEE